MRARELGGPWAGARGRAPPVSQSPGSLHAVPLAAAAERLQPSGAAGLGAPGVRCTGLSPPLVIQGYKCTCGNQLHIFSSYRAFEELIWGEENMDLTI